MFCSRQCGRKGSRYTAKRCLACRTEFKPVSGVQKYCSSPECQKEQERRAGVRHYRQNPGPIIERAKAHYWLHREAIKQRIRQRYYTPLDELRTCGTCQCVYAPWQRGQVYCSKRCQEVAWNKAGVTTRWDGSTRHREAARKGALAVALNPCARDTHIELLLQEALKARGLDFETHMPVLARCRPDIVLSQVKMAVFCDGDYWHRRVDYMERDRAVGKFLKRRGWQTLRFWEWEITSDPGRCAQEIVDAVARKGVVSCT